MARTRVAASPRRDGAATAGESEGDGEGDGEVSVCEVSVCEVSVWRSMSGIIDVVRFAAGAAV
jgi:hypothetical protein